MAGSALDTAKQAVQTAENECAEAAGITQQARAIAEEQANWAVNMGISAHHSVMQQVVDALSEAYQQFEAAHVAAGGSRSALQQVTDQSGREDLVKQVGSAGEQLVAVTNALATARAKLDNDALNNAQLSQDENVMQAVHSAITATTAAVTATDNAAKSVQTYQQQLRQPPGN